MSQTLHRIVEAVENVIRPEAALDAVSELVRWRRLPTTEDYGRSVAWAQERLHSFGVEASSFAHPTDGTRMHWGYVTPPRWECRRGQLELVDNPASRPLADFDACPLSVIQRSVSTGGVVEAELVVVENGEDAASYGDHLVGKVILSDASPGAVLEHGIRGCGALGLVTDAMSAFPPIRRMGDLEDELEWSLFPYTRGKPQAGWGFVVSPRVGQELRARLQAGPVRVRASIEAEIGPGVLEGVQGVVSGPETGEVWLVAHLCHPAPFAHDNASGAALLLECARVIAELSRSGEIPPLKRSVRVLLPVEIAGTIAYLAANPELAGRALAGLNLDMVGANQAKTGSVLCIDRPPDACPSCTPELLEYLYERVGDHTSGLSGNSSYPLFRVTSTRFSAGSDHWVLGDPSVGIPTPMLIEWPDRYYHTTGDLLDNLDVESLRRNGVAAASYALFLACAREDEANWLEHQATGRFAAALGELYSRKSYDNEGAAALPQALRYRVDQQKTCLRWLDRLREGTNTAAGPDRVSSRPHAITVLEQIARTMGAAPEKTAASAPPDEVPEALAPLWHCPVERVHPGPVSHFAHLGNLPTADRTAYRRLCDHYPWAAKNYYRRITHWMDGQRTIGEIADLLALELDRREDTFLAAYLEVLEKLELVVIRRAAGQPGA